jgi:uncharacterized membrane protein YccC
MVVFNRPRLRFAKFFKRESLRPDLNRAVRSTSAFMIPLLAIELGGVRLDPVHACIAAHTISLIDVRGAYGFRLGLMLAVAAVLTASVQLGGLGADQLLIAAAATVLIVVGGGIWRHLSADYGPGLAVSSGLLLFISLAGNESVAGADPVLSTAAGALLGTLLQVSLWPFKPQHPLRLVVSETWLGLAEMVAAIGPDGQAQPQRAIDRELEFRASLNKAHSSLLASKSHARGRLAHLEALNLAAARVALRVRALRTAVEGQGNGSGLETFMAGLAPVLTSLANTARSLAITVISRQPSHLATFEVRLKRLQTLLAVARSRAPSQVTDLVASGHVMDLIRQVEAQLPGLQTTVRATLERAHERAAFPLELFDLGTLTLRPLAASLNLSLRPDGALIRHTGRALVLSLIGVLAFKWSHFPHGYWLPFTILVVLQPDFGSTREKAVQRVLGTLAGGLLASSLLWLHPPWGMLLVAVAVTNFLFGYFLKSHYGIAVVFITLMVVLMTESHEPATLAFTLERIGSTLVGGLLALGAAWIFWPTWERGRFPAIFSKSLITNRAYLDCVLDHLRHGRREDDSIAKARHAAEGANGEVFSSLRRMIGDPKNQQEGLQESAALANGNQRIIHALSAIVLHLDEQRSHYPELLDQLEHLGGSAFETLIALETFVTPEVPAAAMIRALEGFRLPTIRTDHQDPSRFREPWVLPQLYRIITELNAMLVIVAPPAESRGAER